MMDIVDIQRIIADSFLGGSMFMAGLVMFTGVLLLIFLLIRDKTAVLIVTMPVALIFSSLGVLSIDFLMLIIVVAVLGLATTAKDHFSKS